MSSEKPHVETVAEFLARGGVIQRFPAKEVLEAQVAKSETVHSTVSKASTIYTLDDGALFFGEKVTRKRKTKKVDTSKLSMEKLPDDIRKLMEGINA